MNAPNSDRALLLIFAAVGLAPLTACKSVCTDDGFAWQQDPSCLAELTASPTSSNTDATSEPTGPTATDASVSATAGEGGLWCVDADKDGFGDPGLCTEVPPGDSPPPGTVDNDDDCDDSDGKTFPGAAPNDDPAACMKDADDDDWGDGDPSVGGVMPGTDCDDNGADTFPGSAPNDDPTACMKDADDDDWGDSDPPAGEGSGIVPGTDCDDANSNTWASCNTCKDSDGDGWFAGCDSYPPGFPMADCDDGDPKTFPGAAPNDDANACMTDADDDDWGDSMPPGAGVTPGTDCDDASATTFPGAASQDDPNACMKDEDGDDWGDASPPKPGVTPGSDCYDANPMLNPGNNLLVTAPIAVGEIDEVDVGSGALTKYGSVNIAGVNPWIPTSVAVNPVDGTVYAALAFKDRLYTMNYCGAGVPTPLPSAHKKNICGITFDRAGNLYGVDGQIDQILKFDANGSVAPANVKSLTYAGKTLNVADCGMAFDCHAESLLLSDSGSRGIYVVNPGDGTTTRVVDLPEEVFGSGLEYDPTTKRVFSCDQTSLLSIAIDGSNDFSQLPDLADAVDDLVFGPVCK